MEGDRVVTSSGVRGVAAALSHRVINSQVFSFNNDEWTITATKSTILPSHCYCATLARGGQVVRNSASNEELESVRILPQAEVSSEICQVCRFTAELNLNHYPEMVFPDNVLRLVHRASGFILEFNSLDAMKLIDTTTSPVQVACSQHWQASRTTGLAETVIEPFDWTFCTDYQGSLHASSSDGGLPEIVDDPVQKLDLQKLKQQEKILFFEEMTLYEDELHDNGVSNLSVKLRAMPSGFFILLRFFLRVDNVLIKLNDTRVHFEVGNNYFIRQVQTREQSFQNLQHLEPHVLVDPNLVYAHLPITKEVNEKVMLS